ncbi:hypothetical protein SAMN05443663_1047 [Flavobacterium defluvii]|uniref:Uncharacterized protein n=1 Tax=Flavobacterium defluvii TaxID=370979 RepID=A0A1M5MUV1_9FLAO|nr:hypothetical protein SAMN05443663_1047 [Flavobacterium defluvii]
MYENIYIFLYLLFKAFLIIIICKTRRAGIKMSFQSTSSQPVFSETKAKLMDKKKQRNIVFIIILFGGLMLTVRSNLCLGLNWYFQFLKQT